MLHTLSLSLTVFLAMAEQFGIGSARHKARILQVPHSCLSRQTSGPAGAREWYGTGRCMRYSSSVSRDGCWFYDTRRRTTDMRHTRRQSIGSIIIALVVGFGQLLSLVSVVTNPAVSILDRPFAPVMLVGALSLFSIGVLHLRNPDQFDSRPSRSRIQPLPLVIIAGGLFGIGA